MRFSCLLKGVLFSSVLCQAFLAKAEPVKLPAAACQSALTLERQPGVLVRTVQIRSDVLVKDIDAAEKLLFGILMDPATGKPFQNIANQERYTHHGYAHFPGPLNWSDGSQTNVGNFYRFPEIQERLFPGLSGHLQKNDNVVVEVLTLLNLPVGITKIGINSNDGFRLTLARQGNPWDALSLPLGSFNKPRETDDSIIELEAAKAGCYLVRLVYFGAESGAGLEVFTLNAQGERVLVNDLKNSAAVKAFVPNLRTTAAFARFVDPWPEEGEVSLGQKLQLTLIDQETKIDLTSIRMEMDGQSLELSITLQGAQIQVVADLPVAEPGTRHLLHATFVDSGAIPEKTECEWSFTYSGSGRRFSLTTSEKRAYYTTP